MHSTPQVQSQEPSEEACWTEASWAGPELSPQPSTALCGPGRHVPLGPVSLIPEISLSCEILVLVGVAKATLSAPWWDHMQQWPPGEALMAHRMRLIHSFAQCINIKPLLCAKCSSGCWKLWI